MSDKSRRDFLAMLGVLAGAGAAGGLAWLRSSADAPVPPTSTSASSPASTTTQASTTTTEATLASTTTSPTTTTSVPPVATDQLEVICKEAWKAAPIRGQYVEHRISRMTVHHTAVVMGNNTEAPRRMRAYQRYHQENGWPDVAYHYVIDANGHIYEGRPVSARGDTFTEYDPTGHFLVCCDGHFDQQSIPAPQLTSLIDLLAWASVQFGADPSTVAGHREYAATTCPGAELAGLIADGTLASMVEQRITAGVGSLSLLCGQTGRDHVTEIETGHL